MTELAVGDLSGPERERLADHVVACRRCSEQYQILARTHAQALRGSELGAHPRRAWMVAAAAALVFVALAAGVLITRSAAPRSEAVRGTRLATDGAVAPKVGSRLEAPPREFAWTPPAGASSSRVRLFDASGKRVWESDALSEPRAPLSESVAGGLSDGSYFWTVEVETAAGAEKLGPFPFDLARR